MIKNTQQNQAAAYSDKQRLVKGREKERLSNTSSIHPCTKTYRVKEKEAKYKKRTKADNSMYLLPLGLKQFRSV